MAVSCIPIIKFCAAIAEKNTVLGVISRKDFIELIHPFSQFATFLSRNILNKDKVIDELQGFKNYILAIKLYGL